MVRDIDSSYILYGLGTILGIFAILYFGQEILLSLSPTVKSIILFVSFVFFLTAGLYLEEDSVNTALTALSGGAYIVFLGYTVLRFSPTSNQIFLLLAFSSALFVGLGYTIREKEYRLTTEQSRRVLAACGVFVLLLIAFDVMGAQAATSASFQSQADVSVVADNDRVELGTVTFQNPFVFSRFAEIPQYHVCLYAPDHGQAEGLTAMTDIGDRYGDVLLRGGETITEDVTARFPMAVEREGVERGLTPEDYRDLGTLPVESMEQCPDTSDSARIVVADGREAVTGFRAD